MIGNPSPKEKQATDFQSMNFEQLSRHLRSNVEDGLKTSEAESRLKHYGYNEVPEKKINPIWRFARRFWGLTAWMLEAIIILSLFLQKYVDSYIVAALLVFNSSLGFWEEQKASSAVEALKEKLQVNARVLRDSIWKTVPARELVPGDIVRVRSGDFVPADVKIISGELGVDQSALTGESMEVEKKPDGLLYSGSVVKRGEANGIIVLTGLKTYFGRTAQLVQIAHPKLHMEEVISKVVNWLLIIVIILLSAAVLVSAFKGENLLGLLPLILVLMLSAIPVALPAMFTISMALGSMELVKKGVLVTRLTASEDAATMNILCVDKTGTITMNKLSTAAILPSKSYSENDVVLYGALASNEANQDPIDFAFLAAAKQKNLIDASFVQESFVPFDPETRRTEALVQKGKVEFRVMKGAVNVIGRACGLDKETLASLEAEISEFALKGYRALAVAKTDGQGKPKFVGLAMLYDMARPDSKQLIADLKDLGISVKMLTGDALPIAKEISKEVGLGENVVRMSELKDAVKKSPIKAVEVAEKSDGFAEIYPEDKYAVVTSLQASKHVVGMTGDGVNDAPALRQAEVGIAVSNATDVAKSAASVVLTNEGLTNIVELLKIGRTIYERITAWILSKIARTIQVATLIVFSYFLTGTFIISAFAMILLFFMTDFVKIALSTDNQKWSQKPNTWNVSGLAKVSIILSALFTAESFGLLLVGFRYLGLTLSNQAVFTFTFEILFFSAMFLIFNVRERGHFWNSKPSTTLLMAIVLSMIATTIIATVGIPGLEALPLTTTLFVALYFAAFSLIVNDSVKWAMVTKTKIKW